MQKFWQAFFALGSDLAPPGPGKTCSWSGGVNFWVLGDVIKALLMIKF